MSHNVKEDVETEIEAEDVETEIEAEDVKTEIEAKDESPIAMYINLDLIQDEHSNIYNLVNLCSCYVF